MIKVWQTSHAQHPNYNHDVSFKHLGDISGVASSTTLSAHVRESLASVTDALLHICGTATSNYESAPTDVLRQVSHNETCLAYRIAQYGAWASAISWRLMKKEATACRRGSNSWIQSAIRGTCEKRPDHRGTKRCCKGRVLGERADGDIFLQSFIFNENSW